MAQSLTFSQVRGSPHFAWHPLGYLLVDGGLFRAVPMEPPAAGGYRGVLSVRQSSLREGDHTLIAGWRHAGQCCCALCADSASAPSSGSPRQQTPPPGRRTWKAPSDVPRLSHRGQGDEENR
jgi:hypothetical protein